MKFSYLKILPFALALCGLVACSTDPDPEDFSAEELRDMTPIMQFKGNPIPEDCYSEEHVTTDVTERMKPGEYSYSGPFWRLETWAGNTIQTKATKVIVGLNTNTRRPSTTANCTYT